MAAPVNTIVEDGKTLADLDDLEPWDENPREADDQELERLREQLQTLGQYKPLIVDENTGTVLGGNMRIQVMGDLGWEHVWVSLVDAEDESTRMEYALSDNDRVGHYDTDQMATLIQRNPDIDITDYKVDFYAPTDITQDLAQAMDPEDVAALVGAADDGSEDATPGGGDGETDGQSGDNGGEPAPRSMEGVGQHATTAMVQLYMTEDEKDNDFLPNVRTLKTAWDIDNTTDVVRRAVADAAAEHEEDEPATVAPADLED